VIELLSLLLPVLHDADPLLHAHIASSGARAACMPDTDLQLHGYPDRLPMQGSLLNPW
jgi:hypothetical protein